MFVRNVTEITYGMECIKKDYEVWINNMRSIYALCNEFNIKFRAYLQPMLNYRCGEQSQKTKKLINEYLSKTNVSNLDTNVICFCDGARKELKKYDFIIDLTGLFLKDYDTYYDVCHYTDYGNNIISETIYDEIKEIFHENN